jgi:acyl-CoA thioester hydrolase
MQPFSLAIAVGDADVDELGHVNNLVYVRWVLDAALAHSRALGWDYPAYRRAGGFFVVRRHEIDYLRPAFPGDRLRIDTWIDEWTRVTCLRRTRILGGDAEVVRAATSWVFVTVDGGKPMRIPGDVTRSFMHG